MWILDSKEEAFKKAQARAQETGTDYRVIELDNGKFIYGLQKKIDFHYPNALGWNFYYIY
jgi:hypothetical protein